MPDTKANARFTVISIIAIALFIFGRAPSARADIPATQPANLALNCPATASSEESDDHTASHANDDDDGNDSRWCANDGSAPQWWQVDLKKPSTLICCLIKWEFDGKRYRYVVEGSPDGKNWGTLCDRSSTTSTSQAQAVPFWPAAQGIRYVRIRITGLDEGAWASIFDVKIFGVQ
jgi:alpha-L-fucosidase